ncbi:DUF7313 family protein [Natronosalvus rutilus]|uniref:DUF7313 domain-containing protein n=1 Tax=Natronosalvus rutilus TaxID=2953753 RepID=A0A9E7N824_9EURY|nr:hypothetical protein [Natronosalvus rutilus]UTF53444.1 hypothetical protein NGM29_17005 [Natronosalvus rutilus]
MLSPALLGPVDVLAEEVVGGVMLIEFVLLGLVVANLFVRVLAHHRTVSAARDDGPEAVSRPIILDVSSFLIVLGGFYYITVDLHPGIIFTSLAITLLIADFFEFEARLVEARQELAFERPKAAMAASAVALAYIAYQSLFFLLSPFWDSVAW